MRLSQANVATAVATGATVLAVSKYGVLGRIPGFDGISPAIIAAILGIAVAGVLPRASGIAGNVQEGIGYGLVASAALALAG